MKAAEIQSFTRAYVHYLGDLDPRSLACFRILCAIAIFWDIGLVYLTRDVWVGLQGFYDGLPLPSLLGAGSEELTLKALLLLYASVTLCMLLGFRTQISVLAVWVMTCGFQYATPNTFDYHNAVLTNLLIWCQAIRLGRVWSIDALCDAPKVKRDLLETVAGCAFTLTFAYIYFETALEKSGPSWRAEGTAVWFALKDFSLASQLGTWAVNHLPFVLFQAATYLVLAVEFSAPLMLLSPWWRFRTRMLGCALLTALQLVFWAFMNLEAFPLTMIAATSALLPAELWRRLRTAGSQRFFPYLPDADPGSGRRRHPVIRGALIGLFAVALFINIEGSRLLSMEDYPYPGGEYIENAKYFLGLETTWRMYASEPPDMTGWWVVVGFTADGREIDPITGRAPNLDKPDPTASYYRRLGGYYWFDIPDEEDVAYTTYRHFILWRDRRQNPAEKQLTHLTFIYMYETLLPISSKSHPAIPLLVGRWPYTPSSLRPPLRENSILARQRLYEIDYERLGAMGWKPVALPPLLTY